MCDCDEIVFAHTIMSTIRHCKLGDEGVTLVVFGWTGCGMDELEEYVSECFLEGTEVSEVLFVTTSLWAQCFQEMAAMRAVQQVLKVVEARPVVCMFCSGGVHVCPARAADSQCEI